MNPLEAFSIAFQAVWSNRLRSSLTILSNVVSVAFIIAVVAGIGGINSNVTRELTRQGANVFFVQRFGVLATREQWMKAQKNPEITLYDAEAIQKHLGSSAVVASGTRTTSTVSVPGKELEGISVKGKSHHSALVDDIDIIEGRYMGQTDDSRRRSVVVLGNDVADALFAGRSCVGRTVKIDGRPYEVIGRAAARGSFMGQSQDNWVEIPISSFGAHFGFSGSVGVTVKVINPENFRKAMEDVAVLMRTRHRLKPGVDDDFGIFTSDAALELYHSATKTIYTVLVAVVALSLVVGGIVIANIMLAVVNERTREIGIRKALGAKKRHILWQFLVESITLSLTGGILGIGAGWIFAWAIRTWSPLPTVVEPWSVALAVVTVIIVGLFSGLGPALRAAGMNPVEALRYE